VINQFLHIIAIYQKDLSNKAQDFSEYSLLSSFHVTKWFFFLSSYKNSLSVPLFAKFLGGPFLFSHLQSSLWVTSWLTLQYLATPARTNLCVPATSRGRAEKEPRISIPVPAVPVSELLAGKSQRICNSLNWFKGVTFTFWIKIYRKNIFPKINSKIYKFSVFFLPEVPIPALPDPESKFLVPSLLAPYALRR